MEYLSKKDILEKALKVALTSTSVPEIKIANAEKAKALVAIASAMHDGEVTTLVIH